MVERYWSRTKKTPKAPSGCQAPGCGCDKIEERLAVVEGILVQHGLADFQAGEVVQIDG